MNHAVNSEPCCEQWTILWTVNYAANLIDKISKWWIWIRVCGLLKHHHKIHLTHTHTHALHWAGRHYLDYATSSLTSLAELMQWDVWTNACLLLRGGIREIPHREMVLEANGNDFGPHALNGLYSAGRQSIYSEAVKTMVHYDFLHKGRRTPEQTSGFIHTLYACNIMYTVTKCRQNIFFLLLFLREVCLPSLTVIEKPSHVYIKPGVPSERFHSCWLSPHCVVTAWIYNRLHHWPTHNTS